MSNYVRTGIGFDVHKFVEARALIIGGIKIDYALGLEGHSDADVLLHAICDALLGAAALGDIGQHFPDTDADYKNADSQLLLKAVFKMLEKNSFKIINIDTIIIAQQPKFSLYYTKIKNNIAALLAIDTEQVNIKATTTEKLGFTGRKEGIAAYAIASIIKE